MKLKLVTFLFLMTTAAVVSCAKSENHAPICVQGQVLMYNQGNYNCALASVNSASIYTNSMYAQSVAVSGITVAPVQSCGIAGQELVGWNVQSGGGSWLCYYTQTIQPAGGNSPSGQIPPTQLGGEFCNSVGMSSVYSAYGAYNVAGATLNVVSCSPGFTCTPTGTTATNSYYGAAAAGQSGTCQLGSGYQQPYYH